MKHTAVALFAALAVFGVAGSVHGYHDPGERQTDDTAYTERAGMVRFGLWRADVGLTDRWTAGTYLLPWVGRVASASLKWRFYQGEDWAFALRSTIFHFNTKHIDTLDAETERALITAAPLEFTSSWGFAEAGSVSGAIVYTPVRLRGELDRERFFGAAEGAVDNLQLTATLTVPQSRTLAWVVHARYLVFQLARGTGDLTLRASERTTVTVAGAGETDAVDFRRAWSIVPAALFSWSRMNARIGVGYGNLNVPGLNFVLGRKTVVPDLDLFWRLPW